MEKGFMIMDIRGILVAMMVWSLLAFCGCSGNGNREANRDMGKDKQEERETMWQTLERKAKEDSLARERREKEKKRIDSLKRVDADAMDATGEAVEMEAVDLGLSVKWANKNIGAKSAIGKGTQLRWGDTAAMDGWRQDVFWERSLEDIIDGDSNLLEKWDAVRKMLRGKWRMPTKEEVEELFRECKAVVWEKASPIGERGWICEMTGSNGGKIMMPFSHAYGDEMPFPCFYWTATYGVEDLGDGEPGTQGGGIVNSPYLFHIGNDGKGSVLGCGEMGIGENAIRAVWDEKLECIK